MTVTKADFSNLLTDGDKFSQSQAKEIVNTFFSEIRESLVAGEEVKLEGFGKFSLRDKAARPGRNPKSGEFFEVSARRVVAFHPSNKLKEIVITPSGD